MNEPSTETVECAICFEPPEEGETHITPCNHVFCKRCIESWFAETKRCCPVCRRQLRYVDEFGELQHIYEGLITMMNDEPIVVIFVAMCQRMTQLQAVIRDVPRINEMQYSELFNLVAGSSPSNEERQRVARLLEMLNEINNYDE